MLLLLVAAVVSPPALAKPRPIAPTIVSPSMTSSDVQSLTPPRTLLPQWRLLWGTGAAVVAVAIAASLHGWRQSALLLLGAAIGAVLYHGRFGFSSGFRKLLQRQDGYPALMQLWLVALTCVAFAGVFSLGETLGWDLRPAIAPVGWAGLSGAFLFGIGMQLSRACGCGTLAAVGGGSYNLAITLGAFGIGAFVATLTRPLWSQLPAWEPWSFADKLGWGSALLLQLWVLLILAVVLWRWAPLPIVKSRRLWLAATAIALLYTATLLVDGQPWRVTWGLALTTAQAAQVLGWDPQSSVFWGRQLERLSSSLLADPSVITDLGLILGALSAAAYEGRWRWQGSLHPRAVSLAIAGGLSMGFGAFLAAGCNISAYLAGIASTSLHGWVWLGAALVGSWVGIRLRSRWQPEGATTRNG
nr:YeeE/YedE family protein [Synechococcus elongatus PCC 11801]